MKLSLRLKDHLHIAAPVLLALILAIALLPGVALASSHLPPDVPNDAVQPPPLPPPPPQPSPPQPPPPPVQEEEEEEEVVVVPPPVQEEEVVVVVPPPAPQPGPHPSAPHTPPAGCFVAHAATPGQMCSVASGLQYYFIGADGSSQAGPYMSSISELATLHTAGASVSLYSGSNPLTGKSVQINYLPSDRKIRVSTFYPDTQYDTNKPYNFTVDENNSVSHEAW